VLCSGTPRPWYWFMPTAAIELVWAYTYADTVTAILIRDTLSKTVEGHNAMSPAASWNAMLARTRNLGSPGIVSMTISAVDPRILRWWFWSRVAAPYSAMNYTTCSPSQAKRSGWPKTLSRFRNLWKRKFQATNRPKFVVKPLARATATTKH